MINKKPRIAVVGTGWWATEFHIPSLKKYESCELVALVDPNKDKRQKAQTMFDISNVITKCINVCLYVRDIIGRLSVSSVRLVVNSI